MNWINNYLGLVSDRIGFNDISVDLKAQKATLAAKRESLSKRLDLLMDAGLEGDRTAKLFYAVLCEDYLRLCRDEFKSSAAYQEEHRRIITSVERLRAVS